MASESQPEERPPRALGRTQAQRRAEAEQRILQAAVEIIAERGVDQLTLAEAGEAAGYSRALPAHYFGSREDLIRAVADHLVQGYRRRMEEGPPGGLTASGLEALIARIAYYIDDNRRSVSRLRAFHEVLNAALNRPALAPAIAQLDQESAAGFVHHIRAAIRRGEISPDVDPEAQGVLILATLRGVMRQWLIAPDRIDLDRIRAEFIAGLRRNWTPLSKR
ncbi:MAG: TetR/AcrR family transcriptional regulator [Phenylobacterium sp.]|jgi:AcrR family transcriptional regulator|uniref:TetR/AcrR family transcriptional regulator n=1 Tax=Phenylobacterium sp. TaxID=1871053 RepID=UPI002A3607C7|nr:TetR/AcrR family transcriptional regulator [Phenylobacterium sp.]MDX9999536.1 TetR/AcrR family transcriptional regulator [Phenylobacterium sp.]